MKCILYVIMKTETILQKTYYYYYYYYYKHYCKTKTKKGKK